MKKCVLMLLSVVCVIVLTGCPSPSICPPPAVVPAARIPPPPPELMEPQEPNFLARLQRILTPLLETLTPLPSNSERSSQ